MSFRKGHKNEVDLETSVGGEVNSEVNEQVNQEVNETQEIKGEDIIEESIVSLEDLVKELKDGNVKLAEENTKLTNELDALKDRLLRINAEYDNFRKRTAKEKEGIYSDACEDVLKNMLPALDNLQRALSSEGSVEDLKKGIDMTVRQFQEGLTKVQVEEIPSEGEFDPNLHEAVMHIEDETLEKNQIVEVFQKGYKRGEKVLRFSMVKVAN